VAIQRWDPQRDMIDLQGRMNRLFDEALSRSVGSEPAENLGSTAWRPPLDLIEEPARYLLRVDLPGVVARTSRSRSRTASSSFAANGVSIRG